MRRWNKVVLGVALVGCFGSGCFYRPTRTSNSIRSMEDVRLRPFPRTLRQAQRELVALRRLIQSSMRGAGLRRESIARSSPLGGKKSLAQPFPASKAGRVGSLSTKRKASASTPRGETLVRREDSVGKVERGRLNPCQRICRSARAICVAAERICRIASRFPNEPSFQRACVQARRSCRQAKRRCKRCR